MKIKEWLDDNFGCAYLGIGGFLGILMLGCIPAYCIFAIVGVNRFDYNYRIADAREKYDNGDYEGAKEWLLKLNPPEVPLSTWDFYTESKSFPKFKSIEADFLLGSVYLKQNKPKKAIKYLKRAISLPKKAKDLERVVNLSSDEKYLIPAKINLTKCYLMIGDEEHINLAKELVEELDESDVGGNENINQIYKEVYEN